MAEHGAQADLATSQSRMDAIQSALAENQRRLGAQPEARPWRLPAMQHLTLHARRAGRGDSVGMGELTSASPGALAAFAERLGFAATRITLASSRLSPGETPCLILLDDGAAALALAVDGRELILATGAEPVRVPAALVARGWTGEALTLRALDAQPATAGDAPAGIPPTSPASLRTALGAALAREKPLIVQLVIASGLINLLGLLLPLFSMAVFDRVIPHAAFETLWALALGVGLALGLELALRHARLKLFDAVALGLAQDLQSRLFGRLIGARPEALPRQASAVLQPVGDLETTAHIAPQLLVGLVVDLPFFIVMAVLLAHLAGPVVAAPILGAALIIGLHALGHAMARTAQLRQGALMRQKQQLLIDAVDAGERLRVTGAGRIWLARWDRTDDDACAPGHAARYWAGVTAQGSAIIVQAVTVATIVIGVHRIDAAAMSIGALSAAILLVSRAMMPIATATALTFRLIQCLRLVDSVAPLMQAPLEAAQDLSASGAAPVRGDVAMLNLTFCYPGQNRPALSNVSLQWRAGERIGVIGRAGSGKSTLLRLLVRLHDPEGGGLALDGHDIRQRDPATIRRSFAYLPQDSRLVDGTVEDNLVLGLAHASLDRERIHAVSRLTGVEGFVSQHPKGYSLPVGPGGERLSGGERQAVALARTLVQPAAAYLLDEPTAAFDTNAEQRLVRELAGHLGDAGLVIATHRLPLLALVDRIIWLEAGRVVADGPRAEILARLGLPQAA
jgi:ATP-binding cassette subfamily C protein LapB